MARRSIDSRMDRILNRILPPGSIERREYELPANLRDALELHRSKASAIISAIEKRDGPGAAYERLINGDLSLPAMPVQLRAALGIADVPEIHDGMSTSEIAAIYTRLVEGDQQ
jgi:hypothetical protein